MKTQNLKKTPVVLVLYVLALLLSLLALFLLTGCREEPAPALTPLTVTALRVGKADAIVVLSGSHALIIDAGEEEDGQEVLDFLRNQKIRAVDAMIITHFDQDHVGGAETLLEQIPVNTVYVPDYEGTHTEYQDFLAAADAAGISLTRLQEAVSFRFGDADILIEPPDSYEIPAEAADYDNNFSLIITIVHGQNRLVFMGDAEKQEIRQWLTHDSAQPCDFLKVPHHGIYNGALRELFPTLSPEYAVICSSKKNPAETKTLELLRMTCPNIFETKDGNILAISDGQKLEVSQKTK